MTILVLSAVACGNYNHHSSAGGDVGSDATGIGMSVHIFARMVVAFAVEIDVSERNICEVGTHTVSVFYCRNPVEFLYNFLIIIAFAGDEYVIGFGGTTNVFARQVSGHYRKHHRTVWMVTVNR